MKTTTLKYAAAAGLTALVVGNAAAQESVSKPVGYETITVPNGFAYAGLRLHEAPVISEQAVDSVDGATVTVGDGLVDGLVDGTTYIFEVTSGDAVGAAVTVDSFDADADTMTLSDDLSANLAGGDTFTVRPAATLATVFGAENAAGLDAGSGGPNGADVIYIPNADGGFDRYYYDSFNSVTFGPTWSDASDNSAVDPTTVPIIYTDGLVTLGAGVANNTFTVAGSVKLTDTAVVLEDGFNYLSTIFPVGSTLGSAFGENNEAGLSVGSGGPNGADVIYIPVEGDFDRYYYDSFNSSTFGPTWSDASDNAPVDSTTVSFDDAPGIIVLHPGAASAPIISAPGFYADL